MVGINRIVRFLSMFLAENAEGEAVGIERKPETVLLLGIPMLTFGDQGYVCMYACMYATA